EQAQGHAVSAPSDLYSVAIVLYEMLTGRVPFDGESPVSIALKHVSETPVPPSQINPEVPSALEQVVLWALNKDPADRPADADQFIAALEQVREALSTPASEITASMRAIPAAGAIVPVAGFPATTLIPAPDGYRTGGEIDFEAPHAELERHEGPGRQGDSERKGGGSSAWPWVLALLLVALLLGGGAAAYLLTRPQKALVPYVVSLQESVAQSRVSSAGFTPNVIPQTSTYPAGEVIAQSPFGNSRQKAGSTVTLTVSTGPGSTTVPTVATLSQSAAEQQLKQNGLKVSHVAQQVSGTVPQGEAIGTQPGAGASLSKGQGVILYMSSGLAMPNVVNDNLGTAQTALSQFTTNPVSIHYQTTTTAAPDTVLSQSPGAGQPLASKGTITLTVAKAPNTVKVPRVVGDTPGTAVATLAAVGLSVNQVPAVTHNPNMVGLVFKQFPTSTTVVKKGTVINISVGQPASGGGATTQTGTSPTTNPSTGGG
ncbi:MAG: PASTA domain-containing protein, partial [Actinomycetota bacterium]|nr:PASTA domain-containing protein [Actinomycetota bacterium]